MAQNPDTAKPFDRIAVRRHRDRAAKGFNRHAFLFEEVGTRLLDRLADIRRPFPRILELGCRDGRITERFKDIGQEQYVRAEFSQAMAQAAIARNCRKATLVADEEMLPIADGSFDLVVSNLSLHWVNDLPGALAQIRHVLKPDGLLLASMLGGETIHELRDSLLAADVSVSDGASPRVSPFCDVRDAAHLLSRAGFALPVADVDHIDVTYKDALSLMRELRGMGEANALLVRQRNFTRRETIAAAAAYYAKKYPVADDANRIHASFEVIYLAAWCPHENQQRPLRPGEATTRLADVFGSHENSAEDPAKLPEKR
jgi:NADH dehydrogenase [ubiquinone] 1 alpha subcomplex assembly factor 5